MGCFAKQCVDNHGYPIVGVCANGKQRTVYVHRLTALAFHPNPLGLPQVNHKNGIKTDNRPENLEWVTAAQNLKHARDTGLNPSKVETPLVAYNIRTREFRYFESIMAAARYTGEFSASFSMALRGKGRIAGEWLVAKPGEAFPEWYYPLICTETGERFCNSNELIAAGFDASNAIRASKKPNYRAGNKITGDLYHFVHEAPQF